MPSVSVISARWKPAASPLPSAFSTLAPATSGWPQRGALQLRIQHGALALQQAQVRMGLVDARERIIQGRVQRVEDQKPTAPVRECTAQPSGRQ